MKVMLKFGLRTGMNAIHIAGGLCGYHIEHQPGQPEPLQLWTMVDTSQEVIVEHIYVTVTGDPLPADKKFNYLGTALLNGGGFVVHALHVQE